VWPGSETHTPDRWYKVKLELVKEEDSRGMRAKSKLRIHINPQTIRADFLPQTTSVHEVKRAD
jgi:hypothetical protein